MTALDSVLTRHIMKTRDCTKSEMQAVLALVQMRRQTPTKTGMKLRNGKILPRI